MSLETLELDDSNMTSCGISALAQSLQGPSTVKNLSLANCQLDDTGLLKLGEALTTNDTVEVLDVTRNDVIIYNGASQFFGLLPPIQGLKAVHGLTHERNDISPIEAVGLALVDGLRKNTKLQKLDIMKSFDPGLAQEINFYLELNRHGRTLVYLSGRSAPRSELCPWVLGKLSSPRDTSLLFYFLQNKPKIVKCKAAANRKRKASNSALLG